MKYYSAIVAIALLLMAAPFALAVNGDGVVVSYKPDVASTGAPVTLQLEFKNDATDGACLDELIITPPASWGGTASVTKYDRGSFTATNEADAGDFVNVVADSQSVFIKPALMICPGETVNIEISGLTAPSNSGVSDIKILTSDQNHNAGPTHVRELIDILPKVYVTHATKLKLEYFHITGFSGSGFNGEAWGAWTRLKSLAISPSTGGTLTITMETGSVDTVIFNGPVVAGAQWINMNYASWDPLKNTANLKNGYIRDQSGAVAYYITYSGSLTLLGSVDEILDDPDYTSSGLVGAKGTIITAGSSEQRKIVVQLIDNNNYDINEQIPLGAKTDLGSLVEVAPFTTDTHGNAYFTLNPGCTYGIANVNISTDPLSVTPFIVEHVGIDSNVPVSFKVVEGDGAKVGAGETQPITVEVYDSCGNKVSNTHQNLVGFDYLTTTCGSKNKLAQSPGGPSHDHEQENTGQDGVMGVAQVYLKSDCQLCTHDVKVTAQGLGTSTIQLFGVNGKPAKMNVTIPEIEITADQCVTALIEVTDKCDNLVAQIPSEVGSEMEQWESIVRVTIKDPLQADQPGWKGKSGQTYISKSDFREEVIYQPWVQGKLTDGVGHVQICGCQGLGAFDVVAESDTIQPGQDTVSVKNAAPDCIETNTVYQLLQCEKQANLDIAVKDICGNYWRNQDCSGGPAQYCVDLGLSGSCIEDEGSIDGAHLSTSTVCIDVGKGGSGKLEVPVTIFRDTDECCDLDIDASRGTNCCGGFPSLQQCSATNILFHGGPYQMKTEFFKTRKVCADVCGPTQFCVAELQGGKTVYCTEQLENQIPNLGTETVSEEVLDLFTVIDACGHTVKDYNGEVDVEVKGEDTASIYQVDHPLNLTGGWCQGTFDACHRLTTYGGKDMCIKTPNCRWDDTNGCLGATTPGACGAYTKAECAIASTIPTSTCVWIDNCNAQFPVGSSSIIKKLVIHNSKPATVKQWLPLEKDDIIVDKLAFDLTYQQDPALWLYVYLESEQTPGFQSGEDMLVGKAPAIFGGPTIIELKDSATPYWDDQRQGGVLIRAADSKDFYIMLVNEKGPMKTIPCGTYGLNFLYYQDYNSPDLTNSGSGYPFSGSPSGVVEDGCIDSDNFQWLEPGPSGPFVCPTSGPGLNLRTDSRNDDYLMSTPDYGFGDRYLYKLKFNQGQAWLKFRDLVAEDVEVNVLDIRESGETCNYTNDIDATPSPEKITFNEQPATQIKLLNHDEGACKTSVCSDEWDTDENAFAFNIQVTDGFDNPVGKDVEVSLDYCLKMPFGDWMVEDVLQFYCMSHGDEDICESIWYDQDRCFTREDLKKLIEASEYYHGFNNLLFGDFFGQEFSDWIDTYFQEAKVEFWDGATQIALPYHGGKQIIKTDANGQAQFYVTAQKTGVYKIIARPLALDGDTAMVSFGAGIPYSLDLMAVPSFGIPADGEEEAMLFLRTLDECGNLVYQPISGTTVAVTQGKQVYISQDFECKNNYDGDVTGTFYPMGFLGETCLAALSDLPQEATITASAYGLQSDSTKIKFQGAPVKLNITEISPSDRLPADGQTGAWVTVQVQDIHSNRVTGYLGNGFSGSPGNPWGYTDYRFENICIDLDDTEAGMSDWFMSLTDIERETYGWTNFHQVSGSKWCGDLMFGEGKVYVTYGNPNCNHGGTINIKVWDEYPYQGQEFDENGIPVSVHATQLTPAQSHIDFVDPATQWNIMADKSIALADGKSTVRIEVQVENPYMDVRQAVKGVVYIGGAAQQGAALSWDGVTDPLNPTSARFVTDPTTGKTYLELTSTTAGRAEITVTGGDAYICQKKFIAGYVCPNCEEIYGMFKCQYSCNQDLTPKTIEVEFLEVASKQIYLEKGWNFISVPYKLDASKDQLNELFNYSNIQNAYAWDAVAQNFVALTGSSLLEPMNGYWIKAKAPEVATMVYATPTMPSIPTKDVKAGWNAVGLAWDSPITMRNALMSINNLYSNVIGWVAGLQKYGIPVANTGGSGPFETGGVNMEPKAGYWVWSTNSGKLAGLAA